MRYNEYLLIPPTKGVCTDHRVLVTTKTGERLIAGNIELSMAAIEFVYKDISYMALPANRIDLKKEKSLIEIKGTPWE